MQRFIPGLALALACSVSAGAEEKAHEHGSAALNVAVEDEGVEMELIAPGADIVGFEHAPGSDEDRAAVQEAVAKLQQGLIRLPDAAGCELEAVGIYSSLLPDGAPVHTGEHDHDEAHGSDHDDDHKDEHHGKKDDHDHDDHSKEDGHGDHDTDGEHAEFRVHYHYECKNAEAVSGFDTSYFTAFPNARELDVSAITATGQAAAELTGDNTSIEF